MEIALAFFIMMTLVLGAMLVYSNDRVEFWQQRAADCQRDYMKHIEYLENKLKNKTTGTGEPNTKVK